MKSYMVKRYLGLEAYVPGEQPQDMEYVKQWLEQNGIPHTSLSAEKMNLEDVFIGLTGKY